LLIFNYFTATMIRIFVDTSINNHYNFSIGCFCIYHGDTDSVKLDDNFEKQNIYTAFIFTSNPTVAKITNINLAFNVLDLLHIHNRKIILYIDQPNVHVMQLLLCKNPKQLSKSPYSDIYASVLHYIKKYNIGIKFLGTEGRITNQQKIFSLVGKCARSVAKSLEKLRRRQISGEIAT